MSLEIPSARARLPFCVMAWPRCMSARGPPHRRGAARLLLLSEMVWPVPVRSGLGRVGGGDGASGPRAVWPWTPLPGCCMSALIQLVRCFFGVRRNGAVRENSGAGRGPGPLGKPALGSSLRERKGRGSA